MELLRVIKKLVLSICKKEYLMLEHICSLFINLRNTEKDF